MTKYNLVKIGSSIVVTLVVTLSDYEPRKDSYKSLSLKLVKDKIKFYENGIYATSMRFNEFGTINTAAPTTLLDAFDKIITLIG